MNALPGVYMVLSKAAEIPLTGYDLADLCYGIYATKEGALHKSLDVAEYHEPGVLVYYCAAVDVAP